MKKIMILLGGLFIMQLQAQSDNGIFAQEKNQAAIESETSAYAYEAGQSALEITFNPQNIFGSSNGDVFDLINNGIKYRSFKEYGKAMRLGANISYAFDSDIIQQEDSDLDNLELRRKITVYDVKLMFGFEKHYMASRRISPYTGFQFMLGYGGSKMVVEHQSGNDIYTEQLINDPEILSGTFSIGAGFVTGVDYFILKHVYLGVELGIGAEYNKIRSTKYINEDNSDFDFELQHGYNFSISPGLTTGSFRLGWVF